MKPNILPLLSLANEMSFPGLQASIMNIFKENIILELPKSIIRLRMW